MRYRIGKDGIKPDPVLKFKKRKNADLWNGTIITLIAIGALSSGETLGYILGGILLLVGIFLLIGGFIDKD